MTNVTGPVLQFDTVRSDWRDDRASTTARRILSRVESRLFHNQIQ